MNYGGKREKHLGLVVLAGVTSFDGFEVFLSGQFVRLDCGGM